MGVSAAPNQTKNSSTESMVKWMEESVDRWNVHSEQDTEGETPIKYVKGHSLTYLRMDRHPALYGRPQQ